MSPDQLISQARNRQLAPAYLFLGPEIWQRDECRRAVIEAILAPEDREAGFTRHDLEEATLAEVIDDAMSLSLFAPKRVIWVSRAEAALPRGRGAAAEEGEGEGPSKDAGGSGAALAGYLKNPTEGVVLILDSSRYEFDGEDKAKTDRLRKFYSALPNVVEFARWTAAQARKLGQDLVSRNKLRIGADELNLIAEAVGNSPARVAVEIEKLRLFAGEGGKVSQEDVMRLVPQAQAANIFALVGSLGRKDRTKSLEILHVLVREGEYLPLALSFLATQFRQALVAHEAGLRNQFQVQGHFSKLGVPMWPSRAEQILQTLQAYQPERLRKALRRIAQADRDLRDTRPDDRVVVEQFLLDLTA